VLLSELSRRGIRVWADGDRLRCDAPSGALTPDVRELLRQSKRDVLEFLRAAQTLAGQARAIVPLRPYGDRRAVFAVPGHNGDVFCYRALAQYMGEDQPFFGLEPPGLDGRGEPMTRVEDLAGYFAAQIRAFQPDGPYILAGYCAGGTIAFELGRQLQQAGGTICYVALFGSPYPSWYRFPAQLSYRLKRQIEGIGRHARELALRPPAECRAYIREKLHSRRARLEAERAPLSDPVLIRRAKVERATIAAIRHYTPGHFAGHIGLFLPSRESELAGGARRWQTVAQRSEERFGPGGCDGFDMLREPHAFAFAELFRRSLDNAAFEGCHEDPQAAARAKRTTDPLPGFSGS
jgi:thioesterase domain-containing protein